MRTVYRNHERFENTYFKKFPGYYVTGDGKRPRPAEDVPSSHAESPKSKGDKKKLSSGCRRDKDGYYWITGRIDDMLNVSGTGSPPGGGGIGPSVAAVRES